MSAADDPMDEGSGSKEDWFVECDDPEVYTMTGKDKGQLGVDAWRPDPKDVVALFGGLEAMGGVLPIKWNWPNGRRPPTPGEDEEYETDEDTAAAKGHNAGKGGSANGAGGADGGDGAKGKDGAGFDFDEDEGSGGLGRMTPRRPLGGQRELKGSAKKKTTEFKNVLSNMQRHKQMDAAKQAAAARAKQQQQ